MYAITGATGQLGRLVVDALLATVPANQIVAAVRSPGKAADLAASGVQVREADYGRADTLRAALRGVHRVLLISSNEVGSRIAQHQAVIDAANAEGVAFIAYTSLLHATASSAKLAVEHQATEEAIAASGVPAAILRNGWYTENHLLALQPALAHGAILGSAGDGRFSSAARADYAAAAAAVLTAEHAAAGVYELAGDEGYTLAAFAKELSAQSGKPVAYRDLSEADYKGVLVKAGLPDAFADILADADATARGDTLYDDSGTLRGLIGRPTTPMRETIAAALRATG